MFQKYFLHGRKWNSVLVKAVGDPVQCLHGYMAVMRGAVTSYPFLGADPDRQLEQPRQGTVFSVQRTSALLPSICPFPFPTSSLLLPPLLSSPPHPFLSFCHAKVNFRAFLILGTYSVTELHFLVLIFVLFCFEDSLNHLIQAGFKLSMQSRLSGNGLWEYYPTLCSEGFHHSYVPECTCKHFSWNIVGYPPPLFLWRI